MVLLMDLHKNEKSPRSLAQQKDSLAGDDIIRPPLVPSEKNNAVLGARKPRTREVTSRYKSGIIPTTPSLPTAPAPRRCPSPNAPRTITVRGGSQQYRSQSAERRRPTTPLSRFSAPSSPSRSSAPSSPPMRPSTPVRDLGIDTHNSSRRLITLRTADGLWPSMRSLSSSFISESVSAINSKRDKPINSVNVIQDRTSKPSARGSLERKKTPLKGRNVLDQLENSKPQEVFHSRTTEKHRWPGISSTKQSGTAMTRSMDLTPSLPTSSRGVSPRRRTPASDGTSRILQKSTSDGTRRMSFDGLERADREISCFTRSSNNPERSSSATRPSRTQSLPVPTAQRPSSPLKASLPTMSSRGMPCLSQTRPATPFSSLSSLTGRSGISSVLSYIVDARKVKKNATHIEDVHHLRLLYNQNLQWCFANARAEASLAIQKMLAENTLYSVWHSISELHASVILKKIRLQQLRQELKLALILKEQVGYLEDWDLLEREHSSSLSGSIEALKASTVRLPVSGGARADVHAVKDTLNSAINVMQSMGSSICYLLSRMEGTNSAVSELTKVAANEIDMLNESRELLASKASLQVQESSLRTHLLQLRQDMCMVGGEK